MTRSEFYYIIRSSIILLLVVFPISLLADWILNLLDSENSIDLLNNLHFSYLISIVLAYLVIIKKSNRLEEPTFVLILRVILLNMIQLGFLYLIVTFPEQNMDFTKSFDYLLFDMFVLLIFDVIKLRKSISK